MSMEQPTPQNRDEWDEADLQEHNEETRERLRDALQEEARLDADQATALEQLAPEMESETVELPGENAVSVEVKTYTNAEIEAALETVNDAAQGDNPDLSEMRSAMVTVLSGLIETDEYADAAFWRAYGEKFGLGNLMKCVLAVAEPVMSEMEALEEQQSFR